MANNNNNNKLSKKQQCYQSLIKEVEPKRPVLKNCIAAFVAGGIISEIGQSIQWICITYLNFEEKVAGEATTVTLILIAVLLTGFGVYDHIAQWAGAGTAIPITGFANTMASAAIEHRSEGYVLGTGGNMFKLAGAVITYGVFAAFVVGVINLLFN